MRYKQPLPSGPSRRTAWLLAAFLLATLVQTPTHAQDYPGDPVAGQKLAQAWCANCHAYPGSTQATATGAPAFQAIAANKAMTPLALRAFLQTPHERMPDLHLSNNEMDDLIAFILSSRGR